MIYKTYGSTGHSVSAVGFGGMRFDTTKPNEENANLVHYAFDKGINYFDTAPGYSDDKSEIIFGIALKQLTARRGDLFVSTKGMPTEFDTAAKARAAVEKSLSRLNTDYIDFYHVWCIRTLDHYNLAMKKGGQYEGLLKCKQEGLIRHIVVSTHLPGTGVRTIINDRKFEGILLGVNILNFLYRWSGVQAASEAGLGVVAMNPLAGGLIPKNHQQLAFLASSGETPTQAALRFCISCPQITVTLVGFTTPAHIDTACKVADHANIFTQNEIDNISRHVSKNMDTLCTGCGYCMNLCPKNIPIASYMLFYNNKFLNDLTPDKFFENFKGERNWGMIVDRPADAVDCIECGRCEQACTQHLNIIARLRELAEMERKITS